MSPAATIAFNRPAPAEVLIGITGVVDRTAVSRLELQLSGVHASADRVVVVDLSAAPRYDWRLLAVLDATRRRLQSRGAVMHVRGLTEPALSGLAEADLPGVLQAYRASLAMTQPTDPWEPGATGVAAARSDADLRLVRDCAELATVRPDPHDGRRAAGRPGVLGVADRLVEKCLRHVGPSAAAVVLRGRGNRAWVAAASADRARLLEAGGTVSGQGPAVACLRRGEQVSSVDLTGNMTDQRWATYAAIARRNGFAAVRALPIRAPGAPRAHAGARTIGALTLLADAPGPMASTDLGVAQCLADLAAIAFAAAAGREARVEGTIGEPAASLALPRRT